jgi:hypothetical protein
MRDFFGKRFTKSYFTHLMPHDVRVQSFFLLNIAPYLIHFARRVTRH